MKSNATSEGGANKMLSVGEASIFLGYKRSYIYKLLRQGLLPHYKPTGEKGRIFFKESEIEAFILRGRRAASHELAERAEDILSGRG